MDSQKRVTFKPYCSFSEEKHIHYLMDDALKAKGSLGDFKGFIYYKVFAYAVNALRNNHKAEFLNYSRKVFLNDKVNIHYPSLVPYNPYAACSLEEPCKRMSLKDMAHELRREHLIRYAEEERTERYMKRNNMQFFTVQTMPSASEKKASVRRPS